MKRNIYTSLQQFPARCSVFMLAMMGSVSVAMAENEIGMSPFSILPGQEKTVAVNLSQDGDIHSMQADFMLPEGLSLVNWQVNSERIYRETHNYSITQQPDGSYRLAIFGTTLKPIYGNEGVLVELTLRADADFVHKTEIDFSNIHFSTTSNVRYDQDDFSVSASPEVGVFSTDVSSITITADEPHTISLYLENNVPVYGIEGYIKLPEGLSITKNAHDDPDFKYGDRLPQNASVAYNPENGKFVLHEINMSGDYGYDGVLFSFDVVADDKLAPTAEVELSDFIISSTNDETFAFPGNAIKIAVNNTNATLLVPGIAKVKELEELLAETKNSIEKVAPNTKDSEEMQGAITTIEISLDAMKNSLQQAYDDGTIVDKYDEIMEPAEGLKTDIEGLVATAEALEKAYINNDVFGKLTQQIADLQSAYDEVKKFVEESCADVVDQFTERLGTLQGEIDTLTETLGTQHDNGELTADSTVDTETIATAIATLKTDAEAAQKAYVNEDVFGKLTQQIADLQSAYNEVKKFVEESCTDVADQFTERLTTLQGEIDTLSETLGTQHDNGELTADSTLDTEAIVTAIAALKADAEAAQKACIDNVYAVLKAQIDGLQTELNNAVTVIETECPDVKDAFAEEISRLQTEIESLGADLDSKHDNGELTSDATVDTETISAGIEQLKSDALSAQKKFINDNVYQVLKAELESADRFREEVRYDVSHHCSQEVWNKYSWEITSIGNQIKGMQNDLEAKYAANELTSGTTYDVEPLLERLREIKVEAYAAQKAYVNEQAYAKLVAQVDDFLKKFQTVTAQLSTECVDVYGRFTAQVEAIRQDAETLKDNLCGEYEQGSLTEESTVDTTGLETALEALANDVRNAQQKFEANAAQYKVLLLEYNVVAAKFEDTKTYIETEYSDVAEALSIDFQNIKQQLSALHQSIEEAYGREELTAESTFDFESIEVAIEELKVKAESLHNASVNDKVFANLSARLEEVRQQITAARSEVSETCPDVDAEFTDRFDAVEQSLQGVVDELQAAYDKGELTEDYTLDTSSFESELQSIVEDAKTAQKAFVNDKVYAALSAEIENLRNLLLEAETVINTECSDVAEQYACKISDLSQKIDAMKADLDARHTDGSLTAESAIESEALKNEVNAVVAEAKAAQKALLDYQALYADFFESVNAMRAVVNETKQMVETECPAVAERYTEYFDAIAASVGSKADALKQAYEDGTLTSDYVLDFSKEQEALYAVVADAKAAQQAYEANEKAFEELNATIADVREKYESTASYVETKCAHVEELFADRLQAVKNAIDAMQETVDNAHKQGADAADVVLDVKTLTAELEAIREDAAAAEKVYQDNASLLAEYEDEIVALQDALQDALNVIGANYPYIYNIITGSADGIQTDIDALSASIKQAYEEGKLSTKFWSDIALVKMHIEELLKKAAELDAANESVYAQASADLKEVATLFEKVNATILTEYADVADQFVEDLMKYEQAIHTAEVDLQNAYENGLLVNGLDYDVQTYIDALNQLLKDAAAAHELVGISNVQMDSNDERYFSIDGRQSNQLRKGKVNIIRMPDGTVKKVWVK